MATDDRNIYDSDTFSFAAYRWNERGRSLASRYFTAQRVVNVLMVALIILAGWWAVPQGSIMPGGLACVFAAVVALWVCLRLAVAAASGRRAQHLDPDARHDYVLYAYHHLGFNDAKGRARSLLLLAQMDVLRGRYDLARQALEAVDAEQLEGRRIKLYDLLWIATCAYGDTGTGVDGRGTPSQPGAGLAYARPDGSGPQAPERPEGSNEAHAWYLRYTGISSGTRPATAGGHATVEKSAPRASQAARHAPAAGTATGKAIADQDLPDDTVRDWAAGTADEAAVQRAVAQLATRPKRNPLAPAVYGLMLAHLLFFLGVWLGAEQSGGWYVRIGYAEVAGTLAALFLIALVPWTLWLAYARAKRAGTRPHGWRRVLAVVLRIVAVLLALVLSAYMVLGVMVDTDGSERTVATGMEDSSTGRSYDYLVVRWNGYAPGDATTERYYRASDPILMESWPTAQLYDTSSDPSQGDACTADGAAAADGSDQSEQSGSAADGESNTSTDSSEATDDGTATSTDGAGDDSDPSKRLTEGVISNSQGYSQAVQNQMQAVYLYLVGQGTLQDMSLSFGADAKGNAYAVVSSGTEERDGATVQVEHRLYDNGEAVWEGSIKEEVVLEKVYLNSGYDTELEGFYLIDPVSLDVIDEHRTSW